MPACKRKNIFSVKYVSMGNLFNYYKMKLYRLKIYIRIYITADNLCYIFL
ncbi:UNVERIFIED_CONTAM: hypothetical protein GTU68_057567 [Idotea baltica]|nr:hypothetical protein [Idotea baltica]